MLTTVLFILKIVGWILLAILGLILFLILAVLLVPIRYRAEGSYQSKLTAKAAVSWFLRILSLTVVYEEAVHMRIRIFGIPINCFDGDSENAEESGEVETEPKTAESTKQESGSPKPTEQEPIKPEPTRPEPIKSESKNAESEKPIPEKNKSQKAKREPVWRRIQERWSQICRKGNAVWSWIQNEENKEMLRLIKRQLFGIVRHILPVKLNGRIKFGFDDPFKTGQILTYVSPFYGLYAKKLELIPVFDEAVLEGDVRMKGRIRIGTILAKAVRLLFNKNIRKTIRKFRNR